VQAQLLPRSCPLAAARLSSGERADPDTFSDAPGESSPGEAERVSSLFGLTDGIQAIIVGIQCLAQRLELP